MSQEEKGKNSNKTFFSIIEGSLRTPVSEGHPDAIVRHWEAGGQKGTKIERSISALFGKITDVDFYEGEKDGRKFTSLNITLDENEEGKTPVITVSVSTKYAQDIMKKLPAINFEEEVRIRPFSFQPEGEDKNVVGVEITQRDREGNFTKKIDNHFIVKKIIDGIERWLSINGFPERTSPYNDQTDEEREIYKIQCRMFLIKNTKKLIMDKFMPDEVKVEKTVDDQFDELTSQEKLEKFKPKSVKKEEGEVDDSEIPF